MANGRKFDLGNKMYCFILFTDLNVNFRKKVKIIKQKVTADAGICKFMLLGVSVKIIDVPIKNNINNIKVDIFCSIGIVSEVEKRLGDGECSEGEHGEDGDGEYGDGEDDRDGGGEYVVDGGDGDGKDGDGECGDGENGDGEDGDGEDRDGDDGGDCSGAG
jgi:hypothetical protein